MADVKFIRGDQVKITQERFAEQLFAIGWKLADAPKKEPVIETEEDKPTKADLLAQARALGLDVDGRMSEAKLRDIIEQAQD